MKKYKTSKKNRQSYRYYFTDGTMSEVNLAPNISKQDIEMLHQLDDKEIIDNRREDYHVPVHYESTSQFNDEKNPMLIDEHSPLELLVQEESEAEHQEILQELKALISTLTAKQQKTIQDRKATKDNPKDFCRKVYECCAC